MTSGIYRIRNTTNGKSYIGSGVSIERRFRDHKLFLKNGTHCNKKLQRAWDKYGAGSFEFLVVQIIDNPGDLISVETDYIAAEGTANGSNGYNICKFGRNALGLKRSDETKKKMSAWQTGRVMSDAARQNMSLSKIGKKLPEERAALLRGIKRSPEFCAGVSAALRARPPISEETRLKLSTSNMEKVRSDVTRSRLSTSHIGNTSALGHKKSEAYKDANSLKTRKLTDDHVLWIRQQRDAGVIRPILADALGVSVGTIRNADLKGYRNVDLS